MENTMTVLRKSVRASTDYKLSRRKKQWVQRQSILNYPIRGTKRKKLKRNEESLWDLQNTIKIIYAELKFLKEKKGRKR